MPMLPIPDAVLTRFDAVLDKRAVAPALRADIRDVDAFSALYGWSPTHLFFDFLTHG